MRLRGLFCCVWTMRLRGLSCRACRACTARLGTPSPLAPPGERDGVRGRLLAQRPQDRPKYVVGVQQRVVVPETQDAEAGRLQIPCAPRITRRLIHMLTTIELDDQQVLDAAEIRVITGDGMLPPKLHAELHGAQA